MYEPLETHSLYGGTRRVYQFANGRGASVVRHAFSFGALDGLWELAVLDQNGDLDYSTPITGDVVGSLSEDDVQDLLAKIDALPPTAKAA